MKATSKIWKRVFGRIRRTPIKHALMGSKYSPVVGFPKPYFIQPDLTRYYEAALANQSAKKMDDLLLGHYHKFLSQEERVIFDIKVEVNAIFEEKKRVKRVLAALRSGRC